MISTMALKPAKTFFALSFGTAWYVELFPDEPMTIETAITLTQAFEYA